jgi:hypothetical protein
VEQFHQAGERKEKRSQTEHGEDIGRVDDEGIAADGKDGRDGIGCEQNIRRFDHQQNDEERSGHQTSGAPGEKAIPFKMVSHRNELAAPAQDNVA